MAEGDSCTLGRDLVPDRDASLALPGVTAATKVRTGPQRFDQVMLEWQAASLPPQSCIFISVKPPGPAASFGRPSSAVLASEGLDLIDLQGAPGDFCFRLELVDGERVGPPVEVCAQSSFPRLPPGSLPFDNVITQLPATGRDGSPESWDALLVGLLLGGACGALLGWWARRRAARRLRF